MKIQFVCDDDLIAKKFPPKPIIDDKPFWWDNAINKKAYVTSCLPLVDYANSGYIIYASHEYDYEEKIVKFEKGIQVESSNQRPQMRKSPTVYTDDFFPRPGKPRRNYFKVDTDWKIVTPPGYSCLVMQPYYDENENFGIMPGVIDTDKYDFVIPAIGFLKKPKVNIMPGDRLLQVIPFKRDDWEMEVVKTSVIPSQLYYWLYGAYERLFRSEKKYK
jgi:hypothetical protein